MRKRDWLVFGAVTAALSLYAEAKAQQQNFAPMPSPAQFNYDIYPNNPAGTTRATYPGYLHLTILAASSAVCTDTNKNLSTSCGGGGGSITSVEIDGTNLQVNGGSTFTCTTTTCDFALSINSADIIAALGYTPANATAVGDPPGTVAWYSGTTAPAGWVFGRGQALSRTGATAALFAVQGTTFGPGDGSTTFNTLNCQGQFVRGYDAAGTVDPGRTFGSNQLDQFQGHAHNNGVAQTNGSPTMMVYSTTASGVPGNASNTAHADNNTPQSQGTTGPAVTDGTNGAPRTGLETRPVNVALNCIVKE